jgi:hypothetical protein
VNGLSLSANCFSIQLLAQHRAGTGHSWIGIVPVFHHARFVAAIEGPELDKITDNTVTPDNNQVVGYAGRLSDMLTAWRHLWIERDAMTGATANTVAVAMIGVTPNVAQQGTGGANDVIQLVTPPGDGDEFEGGVLSIPSFGGKTLPIYRQIGNTLNVPANSFTPAELAVINGYGGAVAATATDDDVIPANGAMRLPDGGPLLQSAFGAAYIQPIYVDPVGGSLNTVGTVSFMRHLQDDLGAIATGTNRNLASSASFWTTLLVGCFEDFRTTDADPDGLAPVGIGIPTPLADVDGFDLGYSGKNGSDQNRSAIFLETIDDLSRQGQTATPESLIVTHEIGHTVGSGTGHTLTGILREHPSSPGDNNFDNETMKKFRTVIVW